MWYQLLFFIGAGLLLWMVYRQYKQHPSQFSLENFNKTAVTLGILALGLVLFIWVLVLMLRS